jgi:hypothetical protein
MPFDFAQADALAAAFQAEMLTDDAREQKLRPVSTQRRPVDYLSAAGAGEIHVCFRKINTDHCALALWAAAR